MSCEYCGAFIDEGSLVCLSCGSEVRRRTEASRERARAPLAAEPEVQPGPTCETHPGMPLLGYCPRCGQSVCVRCAPGAVTDELTCNDCVGLTAAHRQAPAGALCAVHPSKRAAFICARCGNFACSGCKPESAVPGYCARCAPSVGARASRGSRFVANLIDNFIIIFLPVAVFAVLAAFERAAEYTTRDLAPVRVLAVTGCVLATCIVQVAAQVHWGQSIGKRLLGIKVVRVSGEPIELWRLLVMRNLLIHVISQACGLAGLVDAVMIFGDEKRCLHDHLADSIVVEAGTGSTAGSEAADR